MATATTTNVFEVYLLICWFFGLAGVWDVLLQPRDAFAATGHSKLRWLTVELVGLPLVGVFTWAYYAATIRPAVVRAGGRPPRGITKALLGGLFKLLNLRTWQGHSPARSSTSPSAESGRSQPGVCSQCHGTGRASTTCGTCAGTGRVSNAGGNPSAPEVNCFVCGGPGAPCRSCGGTGTIQPAW
jgi:hypothetical protein